MIILSPADSTIVESIVSSNPIMIQLCNYKFFSHSNTVVSDTSQFGYDGNRYESTLQETGFYQIFFKDGLKSGATTLFMKGRDKNNISITLSGITNVEDT